MGKEEALAIALNRQIHLRETRANGITTVVASLRRQNATRLTLRGEFEKERSGMMLDFGKSQTELSKTAEAVARTTNSYLDTLNRIKGAEAERDKLEPTFVKFAFSKGIKLGTSKRMPQGGKEKTLSDREQERFNALRGRLLQLDSIISILGKAEDNMGWPPQIKDFASEVTSLLEKAEKACAKNSEFIGRLKEISGNLETTKEKLISVLEQDQTGDIKELEKRIAKLKTQLGNLQKPEKFNPGTNFKAAEKRVKRKTLITDSPIEVIKFSATLQAQLMAANLKDELEALALFDKNMRLYDQKVGELQSSINALEADLGVAKLCKLTPCAEEKQRLEELRNSKHNVDLSDCSRQLDEVQEAIAKTKKFVSQFETLSAHFNNKNTKTQSLINAGHQVELVMDSVQKLRETMEGTEAVRGAKVAGANRTTGLYPEMDAAFEKINSVALGYIKHGEDASACENRMAEAIKKSLSK